MITWSTLSDLSSSFRNAVTVTAERETHADAMRAWTFKPQTGSGQCTFVRYDEPMHVVLCNFTPYNDVDLSIDDDEWIRFNFTCRSRLQMRAGCGPSHVGIGPAWRLVVPQNLALMQEHYEANSSASWITVSITKEYAAALLGLRFAELARLVLDRLQCATDNLPVIQSFELNEAMRDIVHGLNAMPPNDPQHSLYVRAKSFELICLAMKDLNQDVLNVDGETQGEHAAISIVRDIILQNYRRPPSLEELARSAGMNRTKLNMIFRRRFGLSVFEFIREQRLQYAKMLLDSYDLPIAEVAYRSGYNHPCNFTTAYRKRFGCRPSRDAERGSETDQSER